MEDRSLVARADLALLLGRVAGGDRDAFRLLYNSAAPKLFGVALRITRRRELAEDAMQEAFLAIWDRARDFDAGRGSPMSWLATIVRHRAIDQVRRAGRRAEDTGEDAEALLAAIPAGGLFAADRGAGLADLSRCLGRLEAGPRHVVMLSYAYGFTQEELAVRLNTPLGTIKSWLRRSLERLKRCLDE